MFNNLLKVINYISFKSFLSKLIYLLPISKFYRSNWVGHVYHLKINLENYGMGTQKPLFTKKFIAIFLS